jgi:hypothetical protein
MASVGLTWWEKGERLSAKGERHLSVQRHLSVGPGDSSVGLGEEHPLY